MTVFLGIDVGSTTLTAAAIDTADSQVVDVERAPNDAEVTSPVDRQRGRSEWDMSRMVAGAFGVARRLIDRLDVNVEAVGVTGQQQGLQLLDAQGEPVGPFIAWQDQRAAEPVAPDRPRAGSYLDLMLKTGGGGFALSGCPVITGYIAPTMFWLKHNDLLPAHVRTTTAPEFLVARLTGEAPVIDPTNAAGSGVLDVSTGGWNTSLIDDLGLRESWFQPLAESCSVAGTLTAEVAQETGMPAGTPVSVASGDHQASFAGSVAEYESSVLVNVGTGGQTSVFVPGPLPRGSLQLRPFIQDGYLLAGVGVVGGRTYRTLRNFFALAGEEILNAGSDPEAIYTRLTERAAAVPAGADGLRCTPFFTGTSRDARKRAEFTGLSLANFTPGHIARALLEGMAAELRRSYDEAVELGATPRSRLVGSGNGLLLNPVLRTSVESCFGMTLQPARHADAAAAGAALCGAVAVGKYAHIAAASRAFVGSGA